MSLPTFAVAPEDLRFIGADLHRPECVVTTAKGSVHVSDARGGIATIGPGGAPDLLLGRGVADLLVNGFALLPDGAFMVANLGPAGGVFRLTRTGELIPEVIEVEGVRLPPTNFVSHDTSSGGERLWISVSTRQVPREQAFRRDVADGYLILKDRRGTRVVADGLGFTNENKVHPSGQFLYVSETIARRLSRFAILPGGALGPRETIAEFGHGVFPDGLEFDAEDGIWIASVVSNRLLRIAPDGAQSVILEDGDPDAVEAAEQAHVEGRLGRAEIDGGRRRPLGNLASVAFGGPDLKTVYLGSLFAERLATFASPIAGAEPPHWRY